MKSLRVFVAAVALALGAAWGVGCVRTCPSTGCGSGQRCAHTVDTGSSCCGAPGTSSPQVACCEQPDAGSVCGCIPDNSRVECATNADCCSGRCVPVTGAPTTRGWCGTPDGGTSDGGTP